MQTQQDYEIHSIPQVLVKRDEEGKINLEIATDCENLF